MYDWPYAFQDESGATVKLEKWRGHQTIVSMEYSSCQFICSIGLTRLRALQLLVEREKLDYDFLVISLDPVHDTPAAWRDYRRMRNLTQGNWHFLSSTAGQMPVIADQLGVRYWYYDAHIMHDFRVLRVDGNGAIIKVMNSFSADLTAFVH